MSNEQKTKAAETILKIVDAANLAMVIVLTDGQRLGVARLTEKAKYKMVKEYDKDTEENRRLAFRHAMNVYLGGK